MEKINEYFINYDKLYQAIDEGHYLPSFLHQYHGDNLSALLIMNKMLFHFEKTSEYEKCRKIKEQIDLFNRRIEYTQTEFIDYQLHSNATISVAPKSIQEAIDFISTQINSSANKDIDTYDLLEKRTNVLTAMMFNRFAPIIKNVFAIDVEFYKNHPIMIEFNREHSIYDVDEMCYELIYRATDTIKNQMPDFFDV